MEETREEKLKSGSTGLPSVYLQKSDLVQDPPKRRHQRLRRGNSNPHKNTPESVGKLFAKQNHRRNKKLPKRRKPRATPRNLIIECKTQKFQLHLAKPQPTTTTTSQHTAATTTTTIQDHLQLSPTQLTKSQAPAPSRGCTSSPSYTPSSSSSLNEMISLTSSSVDVNGIEWGYKTPSITSLVSWQFDDFIDGVVSNGSVYDYDLASCDDDDVCGDEVDRVGLIVCCWAVRVFYRFGVLGGKLDKDIIGRILDRCEEVLGSPGFEEEQRRFVELYGEHLTSLYLDLSDPADLEQEDPILADINLNIDVESPIRVVLPQYNSEILQALRSKNKTGFVSILRKFESELPSESEILKYLRVVWGLFQKEPKIVKSVGKTLGNDPALPWIRRLTREISPGNPGETQSRFDRYDPFFGFLFPVKILISESNLALFRAYFLAAALIRKKKYHKLKQVEIPSQKMTEVVKIFSSIALDSEGSLESHAHVLESAIQGDPENPFFHCLLGELLTENNEGSARALTNFLTADDIEKNHPTISSRIGEIYFHQNKLSTAIEWLTKSQKLNSRNDTTRQLLSRACIGAGRNLKQEGKLNEALSKFLKAIAMTQDNQVANIEIGELLVSSGCYSQATSWYGNKLNDSSDSGVIINWGHALFECEFYSESLEKYKRAETDATSACFRCQKNMGIIEAEVMADHRAAIQHFERALEIQSQDPTEDSDINLFAGISYLKIRRAGEAIQFLEKVDKNREDFPLVQYWLGIAYFSNFRYAEASAELENLWNNFTQPLATFRRSSDLSISINLSEVITLLIQSLREGRRYEDALRVCDKALREPLTSTSEILCLKGHILLKLRAQEEENALREAKGCTEKASKVSSPNSEALSLLQGDIFFQEEKYDSALKQYQTVPKNSHQSVTVRIGQTLLKLGKYRELQDHLELVSPERWSSDIHKLQGDLCFQNKQYRTALNHYNLATNGESNNSSIWFSLAKTHELLGNYKSALEICRMIDFKDREDDPQKDKTSPTRYQRWKENLFTFLGRYKRALNESTASLQTFDADSPPSP